MTSVTITIISPSILSHLLTRKVKVWFVGTIVVLYNRFGSFFFFYLECVYNFCLVSDCKDCLH